jgi:ribosomal-protein-alanine N-acetyltransferase
MNDKNNSAKDNFPVIDLGDYILRQKNIDDVEDFHRYYTDPEVNKNIISSIPRNIEESKAEIRYWINVYYRNDGIYFGIARKDNNQLIGSIGVSSINKIHNRGEVSYDLAKEYWQKGIMTKALNAMIKYGFEEMKLNRIEAFVTPENKASRALLKKCQFFLEGELKQHRRHNGIYRDVGIFSMVCEEYKHNTIAK